MHPVRTLSAAAVSLCLLAGCSSTGPSPATAHPDPTSAGRSSGSTEPAAPSGPDVSALSVTQQLRTATQALTTAPNVRISGTVVEGGDTEALDLSFTASGATGSITQGADKVQIVVIGTVAYIMAPASYYREKVKDNVDAVIALVAGKWVSAPTTNPDFAELSEVANKAKFAQTILTPDGTPTKGSPGTVRGVQCVSIDDGSGGLLYLAKDGGRPVQLVSSPGASEAGSIRFDYTSVPSAVAPPATQTIDISNLPQ